MKKLVTKVNILLLFILAATFMAMAEKSYSVSDLVNPNIADRREFVSDPAGLLSGSARNRINQRLGELRRNTTGEMAVVVLPSIGDEDVTGFATDLFEKWGIGKSDKDNGVLFLVVMDQHEGRIATGYGAEGVLTDAACATILREEMIPRMKAGDVDGAIVSTAERVAEVMSDPEAAAELRSNEAENYSGMSEVDSEALKETIFTMAGCVALASGVCFFVMLIGSRKRDRYHKALMWKNAQLYYLLATVLSLGGGLVFWLLAIFMYRRTRTRARKCNCCGGKMHRLSEEEDNAYLSGPQDMEEKLDTVDYDVWKCDECGAIDKYAFPKRQSKYTKCERCGAVAVREVGNFTLVPPTTRSAGTGEKVTECQYCKHQNRTRYKIPKKDSGAATAAALGAAAILGSQNRGGGFGGGGFGGGFGGGHTGGGGASGSW